MITSAEATSHPEASLHETHLKLAQETGRFYSSLINLVLTRDDLVASKQQTVETFMASIPPHLRDLYQKGVSGLMEDPAYKQKMVETFMASIPPHLRDLYQKGVYGAMEELKFNHNLIEQHKEKDGDAIPYFINLELTGENDPNARLELVRQIKAGHPAFIEPSPGIPIFVLDKPAFITLLNRSKKLKEGHDSMDSIGGLTTMNSNHTKPTYITMPRIRQSSGQLGLDIDTLRHETHHVFWHFLTQKGFIRKSEEKTPELTAAFDHVRSEFAAYLTSTKPITHDNQFSLSYSNNPEVIAATINANNFIGLCCDLARENKFDRQTFLYAVMKSRNFSELKANLAELTPITHDVSQIATDQLFGSWITGAGTFYRDWSKSISELLVLKKITIPPEEILAFCKKEIGKNKQVLIGKIWTDENIWTDILQKRYGGKSSLVQFIASLGYQLSYNASYPKGSRIRLEKT